MSYDYLLPHIQGENWPDLIQVSIGEILPEIAKKENIVGCEIGINWGISLAYTLDTVPNILKIYAIDPYSGYDGSFDLSICKPHFISKMTGDKMSKVVFIEKTSNEAVADISDDSLDYVFIDGLHTYEQALQDCRNYWNKVKIGGIFSGHDWLMSEIQNSVYTFMDEMSIPREKLKITPNNGIWYWIKE